MHAAYNPIRLASGFIIIVVIITNIIITITITITNTIIIIVTIILIIVTTIINGFFILERRIREVIVIHEQLSKLLCVR